MNFGQLKIRPMRFRIILLLNEETLFQEYEKEIYNYWLLQIALLDSKNREISSHLVRDLYQQEELSIRVTIKDKRDKDTEN
eukprot:snap_masked-scaffold_2-processed-gene-9.17-mRNA-1 protein AED:1.00 eAED:1.00 QI:0/-1/0/0/-1/1/1/0/80